MYEIWNNDCYLYSPPIIAYERGKEVEVDPYAILNEERQRYPRAYMVQVTNGVRTVVSSDYVVASQHDEDEEEDYGYDEYGD